MPSRPGTTRASSETPPAPITSAAVPTRRRRPVLRPLHAGTGRAGPNPAARRRAHQAGGPGARRPGSASAPPRSPRAWTCASSRGVGAARFLAEKGPARAGASWTPPGASSARHDGIAGVHDRAACRGLRDRGGRPALRHPDRHATTAHGDGRRSCGVARRRPPGARPQWRFCRGGARDQPPAGPGAGPQARPCGGTSRATACAWTTPFPGCRPRRVEVVALYDGDHSSSAAGSLPGPGPRCREGSGAPPMGRGAITPDLPWVPAGHLGA